MGGREVVDGAVEPRVAQRVGRISMEAMSEGSKDMYWTGNYPTTLVAQGGEGGRKARGGKERFDERADWLDDSTNDGLSHWMIRRTMG